MITNYETNKVWISPGLFSSYYIIQCCSCAHTLMGAMERRDIQFNLLPETASPLHIWVRDFMPIQVNKEKFVLFRYEPDYLKDHPLYKPDINKILERIDIKVVKSDIVLDGGNVISCGDKVIMTDKIFKENPQYPSDILIDKLKGLLEAEPVIIPWDKYEMYGHSDGMVRYIEPGKVLINNYIDYDRSFRKKLISALEPHFEIKELHFPSRTKSSWAYLNFLHVGNHIFVPILDVKNDKKALQQIDEAFPSCDVIPVMYWYKIVRLGGAINCTTWNILTDKILEVHEHWDRIWDFIKKIQ